MAHSREFKWKLFANSLAVSSYRFHGSQNTRDKKGAESLRTPADWKVKTLSNTHTFLGGQASFLLQQLPGSLSGGNTSSGSTQQWWVSFPQEASLNKKLPFSFCSPEPPTHRFQGILSCILSQMMDCWVMKLYCQKRLQRAVFNLISLDVQTGLQIT